MKLDISQEWLQRMAEREGNGITSVGGLAMRIGQADGEAMSDELKPCPHCENDSPVDQIECYVLCDQCGLEGPYSSRPGAGRAAWNALPRRDDPREPGEAIKTLIDSLVDEDPGDGQWFLARVDRDELSAALKEMGMA